MATKDLADIHAGLPVPVPGGRYLLAFSGGLDSTVLLHLLSRATLTAPLEAVHVHHGLQLEADRWPAHCEQLCHEWGVPLTVCHVRPEQGPRRSLEAEARKARYDALRAVMQATDVLLTAHHQDDQAETLLLQLLRGAGPRGLSAMPGVSEFSPGLHARPLLACPRAMLEVYAQRHALKWIEDPSNANSEHARNFMRQELMPRLRQRWPEASKMLSRSAQLCAEAAALLDEQAEEDLEWCAGTESGSLLIPALQRLQPPRRRNLLRAWIGWLGLPLPEAQHLMRVDAELLHAAEDATPLLAWPGAELRRYRDLLFAHQPLIEPPADWRAPWKPGAVLELPAGCGQLEVGHVAGETLRMPGSGEEVTVCLSTGGERVQLPGRTHHHALKDLCQKAGIPPWVRRRLPLVMYAGRIAAIADRWICEGYRAPAGEPGWRLCWMNPPPGYPALPDS